jgi:hypothetical protein
MFRSLRVSRPRPGGTDPAPDHRGLGFVLDAVRAGGVAVLPGLLDSLDEYAAGVTRTQPNELARDDALAFWLNLYNAGALTLAGEAYATAERSVLRLPGAFTRPMFTVAGESLSLDNIEHGKIRRFKDPRIHAALVCGSASCPTLRYEPFEGATLDEQLEDQTRTFLGAGGAVADGDTLRLSRVFLWYGNDFARPAWMPNFLPASRRRIGAALARWLPEDVRRWFSTGPRTIAFQDYDWSLACSVRSPA